MCVCVCVVLCPLSSSLHSSVCGTVSSQLLPPFFCVWYCVLSAPPSILLCGAEFLQPVVSCVSVSAATLDGILELMSLCKKELSEGLEEKEAGLGREGKKRKLFEQPNTQCQRTEVGGHDRG